MPVKIRLAILEDHQSVIDGYLYRLGEAAEVEVVATAFFGTELECLLAQQPVDVLLLDVGVRTAPDDPTPYPVLDTIPHLIETYAHLSILVVSMYAESFLVASVISAGASGYIVKEDQAAIQDLARVIQVISGGGVYFSQTAHNQYLKYKTGEPPLTPRQMAVLSLCAANPDLNANAVAQELKVSHSTVRNLLAGAYARLGVHNRAAAILKARQLGLIGPIADYT